MTTGALHVNRQWRGPGDDGSGTPKRLSRQRIHRELQPQL
jgi:hypothetical protein